MKEEKDTIPIVNIYGIDINAHIVQKDMMNWAYKKHKKVCPFKFRKR